VGQWTGNDLDPISHKEGWGFLLFRKGVIGGTEESIFQVSRFETSDSIRSFGFGGRSEQ